MGIFINSSYEKDVPYKVERLVKDTVLLVNPYGQGVILNARGGELLGDYFNSTTFYDEKSQLFIQRKKTDDGVVVNVFDPLDNKFVLKNALCISGDIDSEFVILKSLDKNDFHFLNKSNYRNEKNFFVSGCDDYTRLNDKYRDNYIIKFNESLSTIYLAESGIYSDYWSSVEEHEDALVFSKENYKNIVFFSELDKLDEAVRKRKEFTSYKRDGDYHICSNCIKGERPLTIVYFKEKPILEVEAQDVSLLYSYGYSPVDMYSYFICKDGNLVSLAKVDYSICGQVKQSALYSVGYNYGVECLDADAGIFKLTDNNGRIGLYSTKVGRYASTKYNKIVRLNDENYALYIEGEDEVCDIFDETSKRNFGDSYCKILRVEKGKIFFEQYEQVFEMDADSVKSFNENCQMEFFKDFYIARIIDKTIIYNYDDELIGMRSVDCNISCEEAHFTYYNIDGTLYIYNEKTNKLEELMMLKREFYQASFVYGGQEYGVETMCKESLESFLCMLEVQEDGVNSVEKLKESSGEADWAPLVFKKRNTK